MNAGVSIKMGRPSIMRSQRQLLCDPVKVDQFTRRKCRDSMRVRTPRRNAFIGRLSNLVPEAARSRPRIRCRRGGWCPSVWPIAVIGRDPIIWVIVRLIRVEGRRRIESRLVALLGVCGPAFIATGLCCSSHFRAPVPFAKRCVSSRLSAIAALANRHGRCRRRHVFLFTAVRFGHEKGWNRSRC